MAKVTECMCGLASSLSSSTTSSMAATCHSLLAARSESSGVRVASLSHSRRQASGSTEIRTVEGALLFADRTVESGTRGVERKPIRLFSNRDTGPFRRRGAVGATVAPVRLWGELWRNAENASGGHAEGGFLTCAKIGWRRRDRRWLWGQDGTLAAILVAEVGGDKAGGGRKRESPQRAASSRRGAEAASSMAMETVDSLEAEQEDLRYREEGSLEQENYAQQGAEGTGEDAECATEGTEEGEEEEGYMPQAGDEVMGVVMAIDERGVDVDIGAKRFGRLPLKEFVPPNLYVYQQSVWDRNRSPASAGCSDTSNEASNPTGNSGMANAVASGSVEEVSSGVNGAVNNEDVMKGAVPAGDDSAADGKDVTAVGQNTNVLPTQMVMEVGLEMPFIVLGETISGRPLLSARAFSERIAWERIQQLAEVREPIDIVAMDWNRGGIVSKVEGIRAFCPIPHLVTGRTVTEDLKSLVGTKLCVQVIEFDQQSKEVIVSEKRGKIQRELIINQAGTLVQGVVKKITSYGAFVDIDNTLLRGLLHISRISKMHVSEVEDVFSVGERISAVVVSSEPSSGRIALSTKDLESEDGLILRDKQRVFAEAPQMVEAYGQRLAEEDMYMEDERDR